MSLGAADLLREAAVLADDLVNFTRFSGDLVLHARVATANGEPSGAVATLFEAVKRLKSLEADRSLARKALELVRELPLPGIDAAERDQLKMRFRAVLR